MNRPEFHRPPPGHIEIPQESLDLSQLWAIVWESKWLIGSFIGAFMLLGLLYNFITAPVFSADVILQIDEPENETTGGDLGKELTVLGGGNPLAAELEIVKSRRILGEVVEQYKLDIEVTPRYFPVLGAGFARWRESKSDSHDRLERNDPESASTDRLHAGGYYAGSGKLVRVDEFSIPAGATDKPFTLTALAGNSFEVTNELDDLVLKGTVGQLATSSDTTAFPGFSIIISQLNARPGTQFDLVKKSRSVTIDELRENLRIAEQGDDSGIVRLEFRGTNSSQIVAVLHTIANTYVQQNREQKVVTVQKNLDFLEQRLPVVKSALQSDEAALNEVRLDRGSVDLTLETQSTLSRIVELEANLGELELERQELRSRFTARHHSVVSVDSQKRLLENELKELELVINQVPETQRQIVSLTRNVEVNTALYTALLTRAQELKIAMASATSDIHILDPATVASKPIKPKKFAAFIIASTLGLAMGVFASFLKNAFVTGVEDPNELEESLSLNVLATIPHSPVQKKLSRSKNKKITNVHALANTEPADIAIECLRGLRTTLLFSQKKAKNNVVLITSASPRAGKSFVSLNLAISFADSGKKVVLVDADMRKGHLHESFSTSRNPGLSEALSQGLLVDQYVRNTKTTNLSFVPTGVIPNNPSELLLTRQFFALIENLAIRFDHVIIDAPPVLAVADAAIMGHAAGTTLLVIKSGANPLREIEQCKKRLLQNSVHVRGVIVNDVVMTSKSRSNGGYVYQYAHT